MTLVDLDAALADAQRDTARKQRRELVQAVTVRRARDRCFR